MKKYISILAVAALLTASCGGGEERQSEDAYGKDNPGTLNAEDTVNNSLTNPPDSLRDTMTRSLPEQPSNY